MTNNRQHAAQVLVREANFAPFVEVFQTMRLACVRSGLYNVYTWGDNSSYTLGHGKESRSALPELVESFRRKRVTIKQVSFL